MSDATRVAKPTKGTRLITAGEPMTYMFFHMSGVARAYVLDENGAECVLGFCYKPGYPCIGASNIEETFTMNIEAVTDMELLVLDIDALLWAMNTDPQVGKLIQKFMGADHDVDYRWTVARQTKVGIDRYKWFLEEFSDIADVLPQKDIASYLGIYPQSLSRIKAQLATEE